MFFSNILRRFRFGNSFRTSNEEEEIRLTSSEIPLLPSTNGSHESQILTAFQGGGGLRSEIQFGCLGIVFQWKR